MRVVILRVLDTKMHILLKIEKFKLSLSVLWTNILAFETSTVTA